jgi:hypothetical protein
MWRALMDELDRDLLPDNQQHTVRHESDASLTHPPMTRRTVDPKKCTTSWPMECATCSCDCKCEINVIEPAGARPYLARITAPHGTSIQYADTDSMMFTMPERPLIVSIPEIPRCGTLYEDIDEAFERSRRAFRQAQIEKSTARVDLYASTEQNGETNDDPMRARFDFQNNIDAINEESYSLDYTRAAPGRDGVSDSLLGWKPAPIVKHDNNNVKLMPHRRDPSMSNAWVAKKSRSIAASREVAPIMSAAESPTEEPQQSPSRAEFILANGVCVSFDDTMNTRLPRKESSGDAARDMSEVYRMPEKCAVKLTKSHSSPDGIRAIVPITGAKDGRLRYVLPSDHSLD